MTEMSPCVIDVDYRKKVSKRLDASERQIHTLITGSPGELLTHLEERVRALVAAG